MTASALHEERASPAKLRSFARAVLGKIGTLTVKGNVIGAIRINRPSGATDANLTGNITISGDLRGAFTADSGALIVGGGVASLRVTGALIGGSGIGMNNW